MDYEVVEQNIDLSGRIRTRIMIDDEECIFIKTHDYPTQEEINEAAVNRLNAKWAERQAKLDEQAAQIASP